MPPKWRLRWKEVKRIREKGKKNTRMADRKKKEKGGRVGENNRELKGKKKRILLIKGQEPGGLRTTLRVQEKRGEEKIWGHSVFPGHWGETGGGVKGNATKRRKKYAKKTISPTKNKTKKIKEGKKKKKKKGERCEKKGIRVKGRYTKGTSCQKEKKTGKNIQIRENSAGETLIFRGPQATWEEIKLPQGWNNWQLAKTGTLFLGPGSTNSPVGGTSSNRFKERKRARFRETQKAHLSRM